MDSVDRVCIKITSNMDDNLCSGGGNKAENWLGGDINLNLNGETIATTSHGFLNFEYCVEASNVDELQLQATSTDGVCITSLSVNDKQLLVGKNGDLPSFWMSTNRLKCTSQRMTTSEITIKDGKIISSECPINMNADDSDDDSEADEEPVSDEEESCIDYRSDVACSGESINRKYIPLTTENDATLQTKEGYGRCASWCIGTPGAVSFNWSVTGTRGQCECLRNVSV